MNVPRRNRCRLVCRDHRRRLVHRDDRRRAIVAVIIVVMLPVIAAFAALTIDVGVMFNARTDLQRAADASAMAAALALSNNQFVSDPLAVARGEAIAMVQRNPVLGEVLTLDASTDVVFGRGNYDPATQTYTFRPSNVLPDAVRIIVRKTDSSSNGPLGLYFAGIFGKNVTNVSASATAAITPRDMVVVADISGSMRFDSMLYFWPDRTVNNYEVWDALPGGSDDIPGVSLWAPNEVLPDPAQSAGPAWGFFKKLGYGDDVNDTTYRPASDPGLIELRYGRTWNDAQLVAALAERGYSAGEIDAIQRPYNERYYRNRVAVALGLARWDSGMPGGLWEGIGVAPGDTGNGNTIIGSGEMTWQETILQNSQSRSRDIWRQYINYVRSRYRRSFQYEFGVKTVTEYLIHYRARQDLTPEFASTPLQPFQAIKDAIGYMSEMLWDRQTADQLSLMTYSTYGVHRVDLTGDFLDVRDTLDALMPYGATNMGQGLQIGIDELKGPRMRPFMRKVIVLITDGIANIDSRGRSSTYGGREYALQQARIAADLGFQIITVSVGQGADQNIMREIASIGHGDHFHVEGSIQQYSQDLIDIFTQIGGRNVVDLIQ